MYCIILYSQIFALIFIKNRNICADNQTITVNRLCIFNLSVMLHKIW
jgi:hypothetical protein